MRIVLTVLSMLVTVPALAEWERMYLTDTAVHYIDPTTISKDGDLRRVSTLQDLKSRRPVVTSASDRD